MRDLEGINLNILNGRFDEADRALLDLKPAAPADHRAIAHFRGIIAFRRGDIAGAKGLFESALNEYGENISLLRDLAASQFHLQDMMGFRMNLSRIERILAENEKQLSYRAILETELMLGKFLEEEARLAPAREFYLRAIGRAQTPAHRLRAQLQLARWMALYQPCQQLSAHYRELISVGREHTTQDLHVELHHSLMLVELRLIGSDHAWQRILKLAGSIGEFDQRLLIFDYIEGVLSQDGEISLSVLEKIKNFKTLDPYEQFIAKLAHGTLEAQAKIDELVQLAPQLPWASYLRLLCLAANVESNRATRAELNRKIQLIIRSLDEQSQVIWTQRLKQVLQAPEIRVEYSERQRSLAIQGRSVDLSKKKMGLQLLGGLARKPELSIDEAITLLWQSSFSPEHYHRLRMGIHRLNTLINKVTGLGKIIEVDSQNVRLRPEVKIRMMDDGFNSELMQL
jgi:predicted negative regulator of RcsB-dependent stress response